MSFSLPDLPYSYDSLAPYIDAQTMELHHGKHHQAYTDKFNAALEKHPELTDKSAEDIITDLANVPDDIQTAVRNNGGGFVNHKLFWEVMKKDGGGEAVGQVGEKITAAFGSFDAFKEKFSTAAATQFGSGWAWLVKDDAGELSVMQTANQDSPLTQGKTPILGLDVWEHAYYLNYQNRRPEYIEQWWNTVNWEMVEEKYRG